VVGVVVANVPDGVKEEEIRRDGYQKDDRNGHPEHGANRENQPPPLSSAPCIEPVVDHGFSSWCPPAPV